MALGNLTTQNPWWIDEKAIQTDRYIVQFEQSALKWIPRLAHSFDMNSDAVHTLRGPRQVGKTTLLKLLISSLVERGTAARRLFYWTCDLVEGPKALVELVETYLNFSRDFADERRYVFLDEISAVKDWQRGVKFLYDTGRLENTTVIMTGSHSLDIRTAAERLPGRRGTGAGPFDKVLMPMKFAEYVETRDKVLRERLSSLRLISLEDRKQIIKQLAQGGIPRALEELMLQSSELSSYLDDYLLTGGIPRAVDDYLRLGSIRQETYSTYVQVTLGDMLRWEKRETYLAQVLRSVIDTLGTPVSWRTLQKDTDIGHPATIAEYVDALKSSFILSPIYVLDRGRDAPSYRKEKKIHFRDPFIFHALRGWANQYSSYQEALNYLTGQGKPRILESVVCDHLSRLAYDLHPTDEFEPVNRLFYWKSASNEVDFVLRFEEAYLPIEVKYTSSLSRRDINGLYSFTRPNSGQKGLVLTKDLLRADEDIVALPAFLFLTLV